MGKLVQKGGKVKTSPMQKGSSGSGKSGTANTGSHGPIATKMGANTAKNRGPTHGC